MKNGGTTQNMNHTIIDTRVTLDRRRLLIKNVKLQILNNYLLAVCLFSNCHRRDMRAFVIDTENGDIEEKIFKKARHFLDSLISPNDD